MSVPKLISLAIQHLLACGASHEAVARFAEEAVFAVEPSSAAVRMRRFRERNKRNQASLSVTSDAKEIPPKPPKENNILNITPLEGVQGEPLRNGVTLKGALAECLFLEFWGIYPRHVGRGAARKAFASALKRAKPEEILAGAKRYAASCPDPQFTKHPSTWLNADCWLDEPMKLPKMNVVGFRKEFAPEPPRPPRTPEEQARIDAQLAKLKSKAMP